MLEDIGDVDTKSTFLPWQNMAARKMEAGFSTLRKIACSGGRESVFHTRHGSLAPSQHSRSENFWR